MIYKMTLADSSDTMTFDLLEVPIADKDVEGAVDNTLVNGNVFTDYLWLKKQFTQKWSIMCPDEYDRLRGFYTRQWSNATVPTYYLFYGVDSSEKFSLSMGDYALVTNDTQYDAPLSLDKLYGNATQAGTPTPSTPIAVDTVTGRQEINIKGKNLVDAENANWVVSYVTVSEADGVFHMTAESGKTARATLPITGLIVGVTYTISCEVRATTVADSGANTYVRLRELSNGGTWLDNGVTVSVSSDFVKKTITYTPTTITSPYLWFYLSTSTANTSNVDIYVRNIQVEVGSTATTYEPYQVQSYEINLGKNLLDMTDGTYTHAQGGVATVSNGKITLSGTTVGTSFISIPLNKPITVDGKIAISLNNTAYGNSTTAFRLVASDGTYNSVATDTANAKSQNITSEGEYVSIQLRTPSGVDLTGATLQPQVERGELCTTYAQYFTPIELCKIGDYQDYIWNDNGTWKIHKNVGKITFTGSADESWAINNTGTVNYFYRYREIADYAGTQDTNILALNNMASKAVISSSNTNQGFMILNTSSSYQDLRMRYGTEMTIANWKTYLGTHNMIVYYASDTPTDTTITSTALVAQLDALRDAYLYVGENNLYLMPSGGAQGSADFTYEKIYSKTTPVIPMTAVRLTLTDDGVINPCGCRRNVQLKMRETVQ